MNLVKKLGQVARDRSKRLANAAPYYLTVRRRLGISNTKYDITYAVWRESYRGDQYGIREFLSKISPVDRLSFFDLGRNHGLVLLFALDFIKRKGLRVGKIDYTGIDPSPLKFAYLPNPSTEVSYRIIDRAIVYDDSKTVKFKYGEQNFGNFNISGSNYEAKASTAHRRHQFIEIEVDTITADEVIRSITDAPGDSAVIVKIDFKNDCEIMFERVIAALEGRSGPYLIACEMDGTGSPDLLRYRKPGFNTLVCSNVL